MTKSRKTADQTNAVDTTPVGSVDPSSGAFTTLSASGAVSGAGITALFTTPQAIGATTPNAGSFSTLQASGVTKLLGDVHEACPAQATASATATLTGAQVANGIIQYTGGAAGTLTLPLATALDTQFSTLGVDQAIEFSVISTVAFAATLAVNTGITAIGALAVAANTSGRFRLRKTATATYVIYRL